MSLRAPEASLKASLCKDGVASTILDDGACAPSAPMRAANSEPHAAVYVREAQELETCRVYRDHPIAQKQAPSTTNLGRK